MPDAVALHHEATGRGHVVLMGGSLGTTTAVWDEQAGALARYELLDPSAHIAAIERADDVTRLLLDHLGPAA